MSLHQDIIRLHSEPPSAGSSLAPKLFSQIAQTEAEMNYCLDLQAKMIRFHLAAFKATTTGTSHQAAHTDLWPDHEYADHGHIAVEVAGNHLNKVWLGAGRHDHNRTISSILNMHHVMLDKGDADNPPRLVFNGRSVNKATDLDRRKAEAFIALVYADGPKAKTPGPNTLPHPVAYTLYKTTPLAPTKHKDRCNCGVM